MTLKAQATRRLQRAHCAVCRSQHKRLNDLREPLDHEIRARVFESLPSRGTRTMQAAAELDCWSAHVPSVIRPEVPTT
jgi:hypothetical protein